MTTFLAAVWFVANVLLVYWLRPADGITERAIVSFPGAPFIIGILLTLSFGASAMFLARGLLV